ncbi:hypothetical protein EDB86DRAFT_419457 [Lactarius hatsudake]|nr:hypothetical protein EDB86DRAFT_419457 [Lactarius hatsudake]
MSENTTKSSYNNFRVTKLMRLTCGRKIHKKSQMKSLPPALLKNLHLRSQPGPRVPQKLLAPQQCNSSSCSRPPSSCPARACASPCCASRGACCPTSPATSHSCRPTLVRRSPWPLLPCISRPVPPPCAPSSTSTQRTHLPQPSSSPLSRSTSVRRTSCAWAWASARRELPRSRRPSPHSYDLRSLRQLERSSLSLRDRLPMPSPRSRSSGTFVGGQHDRSCVGLHWVTVAKVRIL